MSVPYPTIEGVHWEVKDGTVRFKFDSPEAAKRFDKEVSKRTNHARMYAMTDEDIAAAVADDPDAAPLDEDFWKHATVIFPNKE